MPDKPSAIRLETMDLSALPGALGICDLCLRDRRQHRLIHQGGLACYCPHNRAGGILAFKEAVRWVIKSPISPEDFLLDVTSTQARIRPPKRIGDS